MKKRKKKAKKLWGLERNALPKYAQPFADQDYIDEEFKKNHPEAAAFYNEFSEEFYGNTFRKDKTVVKVDKRYKKKTKVVKKVRKGLHEEAGIERKELFSQTNSRQRDMYNAQGKLGSYHLNSQYQESAEDAIIEALDREKQGFIGWDHEDED